MNPLALRVAHRFLLGISSDPVERAKTRMRDAYARGGIRKLIQATEIRLRAIRNWSKAQGMVNAIEEIIADDEFQLSSQEEGWLRDLADQARHMFGIRTLNQPSKGLMLPRA
jgi:hypothetical protein